MTSDRRIALSSVLTVALALGLQACSKSSGGGGGNMNGGNNNPTTMQAFDPIPGSLGTSVPANFAVRNRWQKTNLTYYVAATTPDVDQTTQRNIIAQAFDTWAAVSSLTFQEVNDPANADMVWGFGAAQHCDLYQDANAPCATNAAFDGPSGVLAHCYFPPGAGGSAAGDCHFDEGENWSADPTTTNPGEVRLLEVAIHELGHGLGLEHTQDQNSVMFPSYDPGRVKTSLGQLDVATIQSLYGSADGSVMPESPGTPGNGPSEEPTNPNGPTDDDIDGDGVPTGIELYIVGTDPNNPDTDGDGLIDLEVAFGLNPLNPDTDGDGATDGEEVLAGTNPLIPDFGSGAADPGLVGVYQGADSVGSPLAIEVTDSGEVFGILRVFQFGFATDILLYGAVDDQGNVAFVSVDFFFSFIGQIENGVAFGELQTAGGFVGTWQADFAGTINLTGGDDDGVDFQPSDVYQPVPSQRGKLTHQSLESIDWRREQTTDASER